MLLLLAACGAPDSQTSYDLYDPDAKDSADTADTGATTEPTDTAPPCTPVAAVFFDLGETLVTEQEDGLFADIPEAIALLDALDTLGLPLGVITNTGNGWTREDLAALLVDPAILDRFDVLLMSSEAESRPKPASDIFIEAVSMLPEETPIETTVFVTEEIGDIANAEPPTRGARGAGMIGVLVADEADPLADHTVAPAALASVATADWLACIEAE